MLRLRHSGASMDVSISRRGFVAGGCAFASMFAVGGAAYALSGDDPKPLRPPGAQDAAHFAATCLKCNRCESACPQQCLRTGVLEDGILNWRTPIMDFHRGACTFCGACEDVCPYGAISLDSSMRPVVDAGACNGCGACEFACPSNTYLSFAGGKQRGINVEIARGEA